jgi:DNA-binding NarL/FixJ family response regulator
MAEVEGKLAAADIDLLVICFRLPGLGGAWGLRRLRALRPAMRVLVLSPVENPATLAACRAAGVDGHIAMGSPIEQVLQAIAAVRSGGFHVPPDTPALPPADAAPRLTARQLQVLRLVAEGLGTREIAQRLGLGLGTVKQHLAAAYARLGARSRLQAIVKAGLSGPADPDDKAG